MYNEESLRKMNYLKGEIPDETIVPVTGKTKQMHFIDHIGCDIIEDYISGLGADIGKLLVDNAKYIDKDLAIKMKEIAQNPRGGSIEEIEDNFSRYSYEDLHVEMSLDKPFSAYFSGNICPVDKNYWGFPLDIEVIFHPFFAEHKDVAAEAMAKFEEELRLEEEEVRLEKELLKRPEANVQFDGSCDEK